MTHAELGDHIRKLIAEGDLPSEPPVIQSSGDGGGDRRRAAVLRQGRPARFVVNLIPRSLTSGRAGGE
jgi:hypothetical protein